MGGYDAHFRRLVLLLTDPGGSLTSVVSSFEDLDSKGHGVRLEAMSMMVFPRPPRRPFSSRILTRY